MGYTELVKHMRYKSMYKSNELYWGLGIEEETYLQFTKPIYVAAPIIRTAHGSERYSVKYYTNYKPIYKEAFAELFTDASGFYPMPHFFNAHSFTKMDTNGNHMTTYEKVPKPNPKFTQPFFSLLEDSTCLKKSFIKIFNENCIFDGDTLEFMTQKFYNAKMNRVIGELVKAKSDLLASLNEHLIKKKLYRDKGLLMYPPVNPGFAVYHSNPKNVAMFNNGTYHINITLPTLLGNMDSNGIPRILDLKNFREKHKIFIRLIQWLEPIIIAVYGSKDPLSAASKTGDSFSKVSQRCALSRYIGIGTYDTVDMPTGKILTTPVTQIRGSDTDFWWYKAYHAESAYRPLDEIGMDINYRKHYNHGVEIRFHDWFPETMLKGLIEFYVCLADESLECNMPDNPIMSPLWNSFVVSTLKGESPSPQVLAIYQKLFKVKFDGTSISEMYSTISNSLRLKYKNGICNRCML